MSMVQDVLKLSEIIRAGLACPVCKSGLKETGGEFACTSENCNVQFPIVNGVPVLIHEKASVFSLDDYLATRNTTYNLREGNLKKFVRRVLPSISMNMKDRVNGPKFVDLLMRGSHAPKVLTIGAGLSDTAIRELTNYPSVEQVMTDVSLGPTVSLICDAHDIPFVDGFFDAVIVHAVLEHVVDPHRCAEEIYRVLNDNGLVFADTPFMQQVHGRQYDFERFSHLGHRRLFRRFEEIESGASCGPGMALAWSYAYFLMSFTETRWLRNAIWVFSSLTSFFLKYFDALLINKPGALDAASAYYFLGRKSDRTLSDRELIGMYKGAV